jgi:peptidoglycan L-alanyl-D-glutamate endopeptidase CwlK
MYSRDKGLLFQPMVERLEKFEQLLIDEGLTFHLFSGLRTFEEQDSLYAKGRTSPGKRVTNARGGYSWHNYGLAVDYVLDGMLDKPGVQWSWDIRADINQDGKNDWKQMADLGISCGLEAGYYWRRFPDAAHLQYTCGLSLNEARELYEDGGLMDLWSYCAEHLIA